MTVREALMEAMTRAAFDAIKAGDDPFKVLAATFQDIPDGVRTEAWCEAEHRITEEWWKSVEATVDAEAVKAAIKVLPAA